MDIGGLLCSHRSTEIFLSLSNGNGFAAMTWPSLLYHPSDRMGVEAPLNHFISAGSKVCGDQRFLRRLILGITRRSISAKVIRQGINPLLTTLQAHRSGSNWQITNSDSKNSTTLVANDIPAKRHSDALRVNADRTEDSRATRHNRSRCLSSELGGLLLNAPWHCFRCRSSQGIALLLRSARG